MEQELTLSEEMLLELPLTVTVIQKSKVPVEHPCSCCGPSWDTEVESETVEFTGSEFLKLARAVKELEYDESVFPSDSGMSFLEEKLKKLWKVTEIKLEIGY